MKTENPITPVFGTDEEARVAPKYEMPEGMMPGEVAYQIVHDEAMLDGNSRLNLATFVTTWMDDYARKVMTENMDKNMIDKTEYPQTAEIERRCVNILAKLWNSPEKPYCTGTSTVGSSEACMLGGIAALKRWQKRRKAKGLPIDKPNFIISTCMQVVWEKFAIYWDVEMRMIPVTAEKITLDPQDVIKACDENTICVVPIQGVTITGLNDNVKEINDALDKLNTEKGWEICIHVDAATGGFIHPFIDPETVWDFRLKWVLSISTSGHKFGLVYPGVGWVVWKDKQYLPEEMNFAVNYLGANIPSISINFSRPGNQVLAQYYQFMRLGKEGYKKVQQNCQNVCLYLKEQLKKMGIFEFFSNDMPNPLFIWKLKDDPNRKWTLYDLSDALHVEGWQVPAYTMPKAMEDVIIMRVVVRQGTGFDLADLLMEDIKRCVNQLDALKEPTNSALMWAKKEPQKPRGFNHSR
ncbi:glutamate decarboxylase [Butyricimonas virosa]|uniref:glutamate decarboxylase n=1 Tax=Butyricimonas virosa TaxID=544645 RepID=UPI0039F645C2